MDGITTDIFLRIFNKFPRLVQAIYNQCQKMGSLPRRWKTAKIIPIAKPSKENSMNPSKYRAISLLNIGGKVLEKLLINRINHHMYKNELLTDCQYGFTLQKSKTDAHMEANFYRTGTRKEGFYNDKSRRQRSIQRSVVAKRLIGLERRRMP